MCSICGCSGFLGAKVVHTEEMDLDQRCHLVCALWSKNLRLVNLEECSFVKIDDSINSCEQNCECCGREVKEAGVQCSEQGCSCVVHVYCALDRRIEMKTEEKKGTGRNGGIEKNDSKFWSFAFVPSSIDRSEIEGELELKTDEITESKNFSNISRMLTALNISESSIKTRMRKICLPEIDSSRIEEEIGRVLCPNHSHSSAEFCNCGVLQERSSQTSPELIMCDDCGLWCHFNCVNCVYARWECKEIKKLLDNGNVPSVKNLGKRALISICS